MEFVYWLLFLKSVICIENLKRIDFDLTFRNKGEDEYIDCKLRGDGKKQLVDGDRFEIVAHLPYLANSTTDVAYMWCVDRNQNKVVERCTTKTINDKSTCEVEAIYNVTTKGQCSCVYRIPLLMNSNRKVLPIVMLDSNYYTEANCALNDSLGHAAIKLSIEGPSSLKINNNNKNEYVYEYTNNESECNLTCASMLSVKRYPQAKYRMLMKNEQNPEQNKESSDFTFSNGKERVEISHKFKLNGNGEIVCSLVETNTQFPFKPVSVTVRYIFEPQPTSELIQGHGFLKENFTFILGIGVAVVIVCAGVCAVILFKKKSAAPVEDNYVNLRNNQHTYNTLPVPKNPKPRTLMPHSPPTVEANYSEPKDSNHMGDAMYADPNRFRESTYAEPYNQRSDLYAKPIPKFQRKPKIVDGPNYSNIFGKEYVNCSRK